MPACHAGDRGFNSRRNRHLFGFIAQSVEQRTENPRVGGSIPPLGTIDYYLINTPYMLVWLNGRAADL